MRFLLLLFLLPVCTLAQPTFPIRPSANGRYFVDKQNKPFLYQADTPWFLFLNLTTAEARAYMQTRQAQGFTTLQVQLTGFLGMKNRAGQLPFTDHDFARPNEPFFAHVDTVVREAAQLGLLLSIAPLWSGCCGEGWAGTDKTGKPKPLNANGPDKARAFGRWLGNRYGNWPNLLWILGGDNDPYNAQAEIRQLALGLNETAPQQLITYHAASSHSSTDVWSNAGEPAEPWLDASMIYTYFRGFDKPWNRVQPDVYEVAYTEYRKSPARPFFLGESLYEGEHDNYGSALQVRKQAYWALLSGAAGHAYGSTNWTCDSTWRQGLQRPGGRSMQYVAELFRSMPWETLVPDIGQTFVAAGSGPYARNDFATTAISADRRLAVTYLPSARPLTVRLTTLTGSRFALSWFNPRTGQRHGMTPVGRLATLTVTPPPEEAGDADDWVLLVQAKPAGR